MEEQKDNNETIDLAKDPSQLQEYSAKYEGEKDLSKIDQDKKEVSGESNQIEALEKFSKIGLELVSQYTDSKKVELDKWSQELHDLKKHRKKLKRIKKKSQIKEVKENRKKQLYLNKIKLKYAKKMYKQSKKTYNIGKNGVSGLEKYQKYMEMDESKRAFINMFVTVSITILFFIIVLSISNTFFDLFTFFF